LQTERRLSSATDADHDRCISLIRGEVAWLEDHGLQRFAV